MHANNGQEDFNMSALEQQVKEVQELLRKDKGTDFDPWAILSSVGEELNKQGYDSMESVKQLLHQIREYRRSHEV